MADVSKLVITSYDSNNENFTNTFNGIFPETNETKLRQFVSQLEPFIDGTTSYFVRTDSTKYYPVAAGSDTVPAGE